MALRTVRDAATRLGVGYSTLKKWIYEGHARSTTTAGGHHRVSDAEIQERADQYRRVRGLHRASDTNKFLDAMRVGLEEFEAFVTDSLIQEKMMAKELADHPEALARFRREVKVTTELAHPNIIEVVDVGASPEGVPYLVMEYLDGEDLEARLERDGRVPLPMAVEIVKQVASALSVAHAEGVVHRDLKPGNVFLVRVPGDAVFVKVVDFGISKVLKAATTKLTMARAVVGTPEFMSPEQAAGRVDLIDHRSDQWALACLAWHMLSGRLPFWKPARGMCTWPSAPIVSGAAGDRLTGGWE